MLCAVEAHVLKEVGQTTLCFFLLDGTHLLRNVEVGAVLRPVVVTDVVSKPVVELSDTHVWIDG